MTNKTHTLYLYQCTCIPNNIGVIRKIGTKKTFQCSYCGKFCKFLKFINTKKDWE